MSLEFSRTETLCIVHVLVNGLKHLIQTTFYMLDVTIFMIISLDQDNDDHLHCLFSAPVFSLNERHGTRVDSALPGMRYHQWRYRPYN